MSEARTKGLGRVIDEAPTIPCPECEKAKKFGVLPKDVGHPKCGWCGLLFGTGHITDYVGVVLRRKACHYCVGNFQKYEDKAFIQSARDLVPEDSREGTPD